MQDKKPEIGLCPTCGERFIRTPSGYATCPNGHGKLFPKELGMATGDVRRIARRKQLMDSLPAAERLGIRVQGCGPLFRIVGRVGLYWRNLQEDSEVVLAKWGKQAVNFTRAIEVEQVLVDCGVGQDDNPFGSGQ
jgi:hypothetical protein